ncbi:MAG TPA: glycoside hydrolase family 3 protein, partial [Longimicrobium sp.]|nr:glycoside hydrolase family 3 protein [Longimicrobium sp.]
MPLSTYALALLALGACSPAPRDSDAADGRADTTAAAAARAPEPFADAPSAVDSVDRQWVERTLASLSLREKVGQMVIAWSSGRWDGAGSEEMGRLLRNVGTDGVGGIIISTGSPQSYASKLNALQRRARVPLMIVTDLESGPGMRLSPGGTDFPPAMAVTATGSDTLAFRVGEAIGRTGRAIGLHLTLSPVLDVNSNPANPIINTRSFGEDPAAVGRMAAAYTRGVHAGGLLAAGKHFPGHGDTHTDSHIDLPAIDATRARLDSLELPPFQAAVRAGIDGMLVGHIAVPRVVADGRPASLSAEMTTALLRREMDFGGLVFTDALNMGAFTRRYGQGEGAVLAIEAGADFLLQPTDIPAAISAVVRAVESGRLTQARIDESVRRILSAKSASGIPGRGPVDAAAAGREADSPANRALAAEVARRSITLVRDRGNRVPLAASARRVLAVTYADRGAPGGGFHRVLGAGRDVEVVRVERGTTAAEYAALLRRADAADVVVVSAYVTPREYQGTVEIPARMAEWISALETAGKPVVAVAFGSPYLLRSFPSIGTYLVAWSAAGVSQEAAARAVLGEAAI